MKRATDSRTLGHEESRMVHSIDGKWVRGCMAGRGADGNSEGHSVSVWSGQGVVELDSGDGFTTQQIYLMPLNCTL
jgi:hypothetical protein